MESIYYHEDLTGFKNPVRSGKTKIRNYKSLATNFKKTNETDIALPNKINLIHQKYPLLISDAENIE